MTDLAPVAPGLWRWTAPHPDWEPDPEPGSPGDWDRDVGSVLAEVGDAAVLVDPLVPQDLWPALDERVRGRRVVVLVTIGFHGRSRDAVVDRYGASQELPAGVHGVPLPEFGETMLWLPDHRALVPGDRVMGDGRGGLRLCPDSWLRYLPGPPTLAALRAALRPLLDLPVERVLVSHGEPVLDGGREALARALDA